MKTRTHKVAMIMLLIVSIIAICFLSIIKTNTVFAETLSEDQQVIEELEGNNEDVETYGLFTSLSISINGGNGKVWATVKNDVTLFPATVIVVVMLYSSETYTESYTEMTLVSTNSINDLDMGKTITTEASTGGVTKYWIARMRYKIDSKDWASKSTEVCKISANGDFLGYV